MTLQEEAQDLYRVDLSALAGVSSWKRLVSGQRAAIDPFAVGRGVLAVMQRCTVRSARGERLLWNEYRVFLSRRDHDRLRPLEPRLQRELPLLLHAEIRRLEADTEGPLTVRLLVDESADLPEGVARIRAAFAPGAEPSPEDGEITIRLGRMSPAASTERLSEPLGPGTLVLSWPGGHASVPSGVRVVLGRPHEAPQGSFVALHGAGSKVSRRHAWVENTGESVLVGRVPAANPVQVNGRALQPGGSLTLEALPAELSLSSGALVVHIHGPEGTA
ncbi:MAG: DUF3662 domain-containing protein [Deltaproteobacteria bacterium]|nr:DUF3662 domain-containing protein [Deltaproteobacteria bacterium]